MFFGWYLPGVNSLKCISMNNQEFKVRSQIVNVNSEEPVFFPFSIKISKCSGSCNNINDPCAKLCIPDVLKNLLISPLFTGGGILDPKHFKFKFST